MCTIPVSVMISFTWSMMLNPCLAQPITRGSGNIVICDNSDKIGVICISVYVIHMGSNLTILFIFTFIYLYLLLFMGLLEIVEDKWAISK